MQNNFDSYLPHVCTRYSCLSLGIVDVWHRVAAGLRFPRKKRGGREKGEGSQKEGKMEGEERKRQGKEEEEGENC